MEIWKRINPDSDRHLISNSGRIKYTTRSGNEIIKLGCKSKDGYRTCAIGPLGSNKHYYIHRLVLDAFTEKPEWAECINHKNGIKDDNRLENLEWSTYKHNNQHAYDTGLKKTNHKNSSPIEKVLMIYDFKKEGLRIFEIAKKVELDFHTVKHIFNGKNWKYLYKQHFN